MIGTAGVVLCECLSISLNRCLTDKLAGPFAPAGVLVVSLWSSMVYFYSLVDVSDVLAWLVGTRLPADAAMLDGPAASCGL